MAALDHHMLNVRSAGRMLERGRHTSTTPTTPAATVSAARFARHPNNFTVASSCTAIRFSYPAEQIIAVADELDADTIVVGDRGLNPGRALVLSSVPAAIALHARHHDVLVVRTPPQ